MNYQALLLALAITQGELPLPSSSTHPINDAQLKLSLICRGVAEKSVSHLSFGSIFGSHGGSATAVGASSSLDQFGDEMDVEIDGGSGRIRPPRRMLPWIAKDKHTGWIDLKDIAVTDDAIEAKAVLTWALRPKVRIDRRNGSIAFDGAAGSFAGRCKRFDPAKDEHAF